MKLSTANFYMIQYSNLGVHSGKNKAGYFNVWLESEAGRGAQEIGSALTKHINTYVREGVENLILWSDSC